MGRIYETAEDRRKEREVAAELAVIFPGMPWRQRPRLDPVDIDFMRGGLIAMQVEIKVRNGPLTYDSLMIDRKKIEGVRDEIARTGATGYVVGAFDDWLLIFDLPVALSATTRIGGRTDRNDPLDKDECSFIPVDATGTFLRADLQRVIA